MPQDDEQKPQLRRPFKITGMWRVGPDGKEELIAHSIDPVQGVAYLNHGPDAYGTFFSPDCKIDVLPGATLKHDGKVIGTFNLVEVEDTLRKGITFEITGTENVRRLMDVFFPRWHRIKVYLHEKMAKWVN